MATTITITITISDESAAQSWLNEVQAINEDYKRYMESAAQCLQAMHESASGDLVDSIMDIGNSLLNAAQQTFEAIDAIADTVSKICQTVSDFQDTVKDGIRSLAQKLFG